MVSTIKSVHGREILDSRGNPTVEVEVLLEGELRAGRLSHQVRLLALMKLSNSAMEIKVVTGARGC